MLEFANGDEHGMTAIAVRMMSLPLRGLGLGERITRDDALEHIRIGHEHSGAP